ncbi:MAG: initiation control protein YabA [Halanaerobiales bacterium]
MDDEILSTLAHFQEKIEALSLQFQKLKDITYELYKKNEELKEENEELKKLIFTEKKADYGPELDPEGSGYTNLIRLYQEGYHICHLSFGEKRKGECLFCLQLMENRKEGQENEE